jgi:hypothetical protein
VDRVQAQLEARELHPSASDPGTRPARPGPPDGLLDGIPLPASSGLQR